MKEKLVLDNLVYEELVLLQQILIDVSDNKISYEYDQEIYDSLYEKVMTA